MRYTKTERAEGLIAIVLIAWVAFFLFLATTQIQHYDSDIFWALRTGSWIVEHWKVPFTDPFSYTFAGKPWVDFTWGFQVIAHVFYTRLGGWTGLYILQLLLTFAAFIALFFNIRLLTSKRLWLLALLMVLTLACALPRLFIRPHLFGFLFISLYLLILNKNERKDRFWLLYLIFPIQVLWVNIHSSAILGVFIVWAYASGEFIDAFLSEGFKGFAEVVRKNKRLWILAVLLPFVTLINPYGLKLAIFPFIHQGGVNSDALRHIGEWSSLPLKDLLFFYPTSISNLAFKLLFYIGLISLGLNWSRIKVRDLMLFAGAAYMGISHVRWMGQFAFFAGPIIAFNMSAYMKGRGGSFISLRWVGLAAAIFMSVFMGLMLRDSKFIHGIGIGVSTADYPVGSLKFMRENELRGKIYNTYIFGGYLIFKYPGLKVFIDGRTPTVYSPHFFWKSRHTQNSRDWKRLAGEYGFTMALVKPDRPLCKILYKSSEWSPVVFDDISVLYLKKDSLYADIIKEKGLSFSPCSSKIYVLPVGKKKRLLMKEELLDVMRSIGDGKNGIGFAYPHRLLGMLEGQLKEKGHKERSVAELIKAVKIKRDGLTYYDLGIALGKLSRPEAAITAFRTSIRIDKGLKQSYLALGITSFDSHDYENSAKWLEEYVKRANDKAGFLGLKTLGRVYFKLGRLKMAEDMLKRAVFLADNKQTRGEVQYYLGNTLFEANRLNEGSYYYRRAMANESGYEKVLENLALMFEEKKDKARAAAIRGILDKGLKKD